MAQYQIPRQCGHPETVQIYGTNVHGEREKHAAYLTARPCTACWQQREQDAREARDTEAVAQAEAEGLPALEGSGKQVAWAVTIRQDALNSLRAELARRRDAAIVEAVMPIYRRIAAREPAARAWIDGRDNPRAILRKLRTPEDDAEAKFILASR
jgi:hypothetical protein